MKNLDYYKTRSLDMIKESVYSGKEFKELWPDHLALVKGFLTKLIGVQCIKSLREGVK